MDKKNNLVDQQILTGLTVLARIIARVEATLIFSLDKNKDLEKLKSKPKLENNLHYNG